jgi:hypothetical protein
MSLMYVTLHCAALIRLLIYMFRISLDPTYINFVRSNFHEAVR